MKLHEKTVKRIKNVISFGIIFCIGVAFFFIFFNILPENIRYIYGGLTIAYFIPPAGKETVIPAALSQGIPLEIWGISLWVYDLLTCFVVLTNWWIIELLIEHIPAFPFIGIRRHQKPRLYKKTISLKTWYAGLHIKTQKIVSKRYGKLLPIALFIFMMVPFQGTGALSTSIIGTWLGLRYYYIIAMVSFASFLSISLITAALLGILNFM